MDYAPSTHWDSTFQRLASSSTDLDWRDQWTGAFIETFRACAVRNILDLGCGTGNDVARLAKAGFHVWGLDYSAVGIQRAAQKGSAATSYVRADMARPLPFAAASFDTVMSNVALHMFSDAITREIFKEIGRLVRPNGLFAFHLNAVEDRPMRAKWHPMVREIEPDYILEQNGQTMHFFSEAYLRDLLSNWSIMTLEFVEVPHWETGEPFKRVWRGIARK